LECGVKGKPEAKRFSDQNKISKTDALSEGVIGACSYLLLDSFMLDDITPFSPFTQVNNLLVKISISYLHFICVGFGVIGLILIMIRKLKKH
jgi:hypothetical protein